MNVSERTCSVDGCERPFVARGWCLGHYTRWRNSGDVGLAEFKPRRKGAICAVEGCGRLVHDDKAHGGRGWCGKHYQRWRATGDPTTPLLPSNNWLGARASYDGIHTRLKKWRGPARTYPCAHCGEAANDWAYDGTCPDEKIDVARGYPLAYSTDLERYMPLCRSCHSRFDENIPSR